MISLSVLFNDIELIILSVTESNSCIVELHNGTQIIDNSSVSSISNFKGVSIIPVIILSVDILVVDNFDAVFVSKHIFQVEIIVPQAYKTIPDLFIIT